MPTFDDYRNIDIDIDGANDWIPEIRLSGGDVEGRTITVRLLKDGKVIDAPTEPGSVTFTARLLFNPKVGTAYPGGYKTMSKFVSKSTTGEDMWGFRVTVPRAAFTNLTGSHTAMAIEVQKTTGTGNAAKDEIVCSRTFNAIVDESVLKAGDGTDPDPLEEWHNLISHGDDKIQDVVDRGNAAIATFNTNGQNAIDGFNTKGNAAVDAFKTKGDNAVHTFEVDSAQSIADFNTKSDQAVADFNTSSKAKLDKFDTDSQAAIDGVNTVKNDMQSLVDGANIAAGTVTERKPNEAPTFDLTGDKWDKTMNLGLPRGSSIASITANTLQAGQQATVTSNKNADGDYNVEVGLPTGPQGVDGFPVFVFTSAISSTVSDYSIAKNSGNISPRPDTDTNYANKAFIMDADGSVFLVFRDDKEGLHVNGSQRLLSLKGPAGDTGGVATADKVGVVKPGFGLEVDSAGTLSVSHVEPPVEGDYDVAKIHGNDSTGAGVLIDRTKGLVSSDAGVAVNLSADNPGLEFDAAGGLKATAQTIGDGSHTSKGILQVGDGLNVDNGVVSLKTATPTNLGGVYYDDTTIQMDGASRLFASIGCVLGVTVNGKQYSNIAPKPICFYEYGYDRQWGVWFGFYVHEQAITFNQIFLNFRLVNGHIVSSDVLSNLALILTSRMIITEKRDVYYISSATTSDWGIDLTLQSDLTLDVGPHWFNVTDGS